MERNTEDFFHLASSQIPLSFLCLNLCFNPGFVRVLRNLEGPGILLWLFPGLESPRKRTLVLKSSGGLLHSAKKISSVWKAVRRINIEILGL